MEHNRAGYEWTDTPGKSRNTKFIKVLEATSRRTVLRHHSRPILFKDFDGSLVQVKLSNEHATVNLLPKKFIPGDHTHVYLPQARGIIQIAKAPRYQCDCGRIHVSDYPYQSVWCQCGGRAHRLAIEEQIKNGDGNQFAGLLRFGLGGLTDTKPLVQSS